MDRIPKVEQTEVEVEDEVEAATCQQESGQEPPDFGREFEYPRTVEDEVLEGDKSAVDESGLEEHGRDQDSGAGGLVRSVQFDTPSSSYLVTGGALRKIWTMSWAMLKRVGRRRDLDWIKAAQRMREGRNVEVDG